MIETILFKRVDIWNWLFETGDPKYRFLDYYTIMKLHLESVLKTIDSKWLTYGF